MTLPQTIEISAPEAEQLMQTWRAQDNVVLWVVTANAHDLPGKWVARPHLIKRGGTSETFAQALVRNTHQDLLLALPVGVTRIQRYREDDSVIVEVWIG
jgi:hypothetical protein